MRTRREEWRKRVARWKDSGLTAQEYASEAGLNPRTLAWWKSALEREAREASARPSRASAQTPLKLIELAPPVAAACTIELELGSGRRLRFTEAVAPEAIARLLAVLEARS